MLQLTRWMLQLIGLKEEPCCKQGPEKLLKHHQWSGFGTSFVAFYLLGALPVPTEHVVEVVFVVLPSLLVVVDVVWVH